MVGVKGWGGKGQGVGEVVGSRGGIGRVGVVRVKGWGLGWWGSRGGWGLGVVKV